MSIRMPRVNTPFLTLWIEFFACPLREDRGLLRLVAVVEHALLVDVGERVEVRVGDAVITHGDPVGGDALHRDLVRLRIVDGLYGIGVRGQRHGHAVADERGSLPPLLGRDEVQRADLVGRAPAPPVGQLRLPARVLLGGYGARVAALSVNAVPAREAATNSPARICFFIEALLSFFIATTPLAISL